jgi:hypothetical protein
MRRQTSKALGIRCSRGPRRVPSRVLLPPGSEERDRLWRPEGEMNPGIWASWCRWLIASPVAGSRSCGLQGA